MGIGPVFAIPRLLERHNLKIDDIDIWELNEAFAVQVIYCRDKLGIDPEKLNVNGGSGCGRPSLRHDRFASGRPCAGRRPSPQGEVRRGHDVRRRRHGAAGLFEILQ